jgi:hypothetical protein
MAREMRRAWLPSWRPHPRPPTHRSHPAPPTRHAPVQRRGRAGQAVAVEAALPRAGHGGDHQRAIVAGGNPAHAVVVRVRAKHLAVRAHGDAVRAVELRVARRGAVARKARDAGRARDGHHGAGGAIHAPQHVLTRDGDVQVVAAAGAVVRHRHGVRHRRRRRRAAVARLAQRARARQRHQRRRAARGGGAQHARRRRRGGQRQRRGGPAASGGRHWGRRLTETTAGDGHEGRRERCGVLLDTDVTEAVIESRGALKFCAHVHSYAQRTRNKLPPVGSRPPGGLPAPLAAQASLPVSKQATGTSHGAPGVRAAAAAVVAALSCSPVLAPAVAAAGLGDGGCRRGRLAAATGAQLHPAAAG